MDDIQWHSPFRGAVKIELSEYNDILEYEDERTLTKKPLFIDLLVIKKQAEEQINNPIGSIFRGWNVMEYKSPTDYVSIDDFYKVCAYAYILKSDTDNVDSIKFEDITISFVSTSITEYLFEHLENIREYKKSVHVKGIYYFIRSGDIPIQFIILDELDKQYKWLAGLTNHISKEMLFDLVKDYSEKEKNEYKEAVLNAVFNTNHEIARKLKEEEDMTMSKEMLELFRPEIEEAKKEGRIEGEMKWISAIKKKKERGMAEPYIADMLELHVDYVKEIYELLDKYPELSVKEVTEMFVNKNERQLA